MNKGRQNGSLSSLVVIPRCLCVGVKVGQMRTICDGVRSNGEKVDGRFVGLSA